ncbi:hypothetical protein [Spongiactinospora sp. 9N601]|uniref:hypothetical protein n=1 Tax=Spongiactinospora sp. 9N601 TaxID=3375149 RepID=UPI0037BB1A0C
MEIVTGLDNHDDDAIAPEDLMPLLQPAILVLDSSPAMTSAPPVELINDCADGDPTTTGS